MISDPDRGDQVREMSSNILHVHWGGQPVIVPPGIVVRQELKTLNSKYQPVEKDRQVDPGQIVVRRMTETINSLVTLAVPEVKMAKSLGVVALGELGHGLG